MRFNAVIRIRALWVAGDACGLVCDATDLQIAEGPPGADCPFKTGPFFVEEMPSKHGKHSTALDFLEQRTSSEYFLHSHPTKPSH